LQLGAEIVLAGEERALGIRALEEQPVAIRLLHLEAERRLEQADGELQIRHQRIVRVAPANHWYSRSARSRARRIRKRVLLSGALFDGLSWSCDACAHATPSA